MPSLAHGRSRTPARSGWALTVVASLGLHLGLALWIWQLPAPDALLPPELVWLTTSYRQSASSKVQHAVRCSACQVMPIMGMR